MISILLALFSLFPVSFIIFAMSERMIVRHESRIGKQITFTGFAYQTWVDSFIEVKALTKNWIGFLYLLQFSIIFIFDVNIEYLIFFYLTLNTFILVHLSRSNDLVSKRIESDRLQVRYAIATGIAALCVFGSFTPSHTTSLASLHWSPLQLLFIIPFQLSGMILFGEHPFQGMSKKVGWIDSARFYVWSMLSAQLFLDGGSYFIDLHIKAAFLYFVCRLFGNYFPTFYHKDLVRISILYLFPLTGLLWLFSMLIFGIMGDTSNV